MYIHVKNITVLCEKFYIFKGEVLFTYVRDKIYLYERDIIYFGEGCSDGRLKTSCALCKYINVFNPQVCI